MPRLLGFGTGWKQDDVENASSNEHGSDRRTSATSGNTLLPRSVASLVSFITHSTSVSLRLGTFFGGVALDGARATTLTGLELSRAVIEGILTRAGRDVAIRSSGNHGRAEAESILERSLATLHMTVTSASFFAAATFHFSSTTLSSAAHMSQALLSTLDAILGSTESSRAIAAIITLIRRECRAPNTNIGNEKIGVGDLLIGTVGFAMLQRWGRKNTERYIRMNGGDETIWDVVILDNGLRADVVETHLIQPNNDCPANVRIDSSRSSFISPGTDEETFDAVQRPRSMVDAPESPSIMLPENQHQISDEDVRLYIMRQLPQGCRASIKTDLITAHTITVDVYDDDNGEIVAPPGTMIVEERFHNDPHNANRIHSNQQLPKHTIVFRTAFNKSQSADVRPPSRHVIGTSDEQQSQNPQHLHEIESSGRSHRESDPPNNDRNKSLSRQNLDASVRSWKQDHEKSNPRISNEQDTTSRSTFGKGSLTKIAQKVKPGIGEKSESTKRPSLRLPFEKHSQSFGPRNAIQRNNKPSKASTTEKKLPFQGQPSHPGQHAEPGKILVPPKSGPSSPVANRGVPRAPLQDTRMRPTSSTTGRYINKRDSRHGRDSRTEYFEVHEKNQESYMTQADAYSLSMDLRSSSPTAMRTHVRSSSSMSLTRSEADTTVSIHNDSHPNPSAFHRRSKSVSSSVYSIATVGSETSLVLAHRSRKSAYDDASTIQALNRDGIVPGIFPQTHFVRNIRRFCRFSSASYGSNALKVMGVPQPPKAPPQYEDAGNQEHSDFSDHIGLPTSTILLSSFVDPSGGSNAAGETESGVPLVHYLFLDHESKAVVLALRGTWGFEDVLTDMTCDYDDLLWQGKSWKVHKGMHASAKRLLMGGGGRVMITMRAALEEFPDYGVVLCGHSLGGGVAALLATMISEPKDEMTRTSFTTTSYSDGRLMLPSGEGDEDSQHAYYLPPGRPIHVYAYGPPSTMSPFLRRATRGLITTVVNGQDVVPSLSLGILHDMHTVSLAFKSDISEAKSHVQYRVWESLRQSILNKFYVNEAPILLHAGDGVGEDAWAWNTLKTLRESMCAPKLLPPGEVFVVDTMRVLQRNAFTSELSEDGYPRLGRPATRVQLKFIRDVEGRFGELRFGSGMFSDHNPARYEASLAALARGILDD